MAKRSKDWNEGLAHDLQDPAFARQFLMASLEESVPLTVALGKIVRAYGVKEFAHEAGMAASNVVRALRPRHNPTQETMNRLLKPLGLRLTVAPLPIKRKRRIA